MRLAILAIYTDSWQPIADIVLHNLWEYADRHGYKLVVKEYEQPYPDMGYQKLVEIKKLFSEGVCDIVWMVDIDTLVTNHTIQVERFIDEYHDVFITNSVNGINCGSFIVRDSEWSHDFINWLLRQQGTDGMYCEQDAMNKYMREYPNNPIKIVGHPSFNSLMYSLYPEHPEVTKEEDGNWNESHLLLHLPGIGMDKRAEILSNTKVKK